MTTDSLRLHTLGDLELLSGDTKLLTRRHKVLAVLAWLARQQGPHRRSTVATLFWGERDDARARQSLRNALSELRTVLGNRLEADEVRINLVPGAVAQDVADFEAAVAEERWEDAVALWKGEYLSGAEDLGTDEWSAWLARERASLHRRLGWAFARLVEKAETTGDALAVMSWASRWSAALPDDEEVAARLIESMLLTGRGPEAAARYTQFVMRCRDEGREPGTRFLRLADRMSASLATPASAPAMQQALLSPVLVDRDDALIRLHEAWRQAVGGVGRVVVIEADEGLGKSRLCRETVRSIRRSDPAALVIDARAYASGRDADWSTLRNLVRQMTDARGLAGAPPESLATLAELEPELRVRFRGLPASGGATGAEEAFARVLEELAAEQPVLLVLDDAPLADRRSLRAITRVMHNVAARMMLVLAGTHHGFAESPLAADLRQGAGDAIRVPLGPLDHDGVVALLGSMAPVSPATIAALRDPLHEATAGVPGLVVEAITRLAEEEALAPDYRGEWRLTRPIGELKLMTPSGAMDITLARLKRLPERNRQVLEAAAVVGPVVEQDVLESVTEMSATEFRDALGDLLLRRLLRTTPGDARKFEFSSEVTRRAVYELTAPSRRRRLHRRTERWRGQSGSDSNFRMRRWIGVAVGAAVLIAGAWWRAESRADLPLTVVLADPRNATGDSIFDGALLSAATIGLQQSRTLSIFPRQRVREVLTRMGKPVDSPLESALAREVAVREGIPVVVEISVERAPSGYQLGLRLVEPDGGGDLASAREIVPREEVLEGLDRLVRLARRELGETATQVENDRRGLPRVTTASLDALKAYATGRRAWERRDYAAAGEHWRRAVQLDTAFAMAHAALADFAFLQLNDPTLGEQYLSHALDLSNRLSEREELQLRFAAARYRGNPVQAASLARLIAEQYPERDTWYSLGTVLMRQQRCVEAIPAFHSALTVDSVFVNGWINLATCHQILDQPDLALAAYARASAFDSTILLSGNLNQEWGRVFVRLDRLASADSAFSLMLALGNPLLRARGMRSLGFLRMYEGKYGDAINHFRAAAEIQRQNQSSVAELRNRTLLAEALVTAGRLEEAAAELERVDHLLEMSRAAAAFWFYASHAWRRTGLMSRAVRLLTRVPSAPQADISDLSSVTLARGLLALTENQPRAALDAVATDTYEAYAAYRHSIRVDAFEALGMPDSALAAARDLASGFHFGFDSQDAWLRAGIRIGRLSEMVGDSAGARAALRAYLDRWSDGDPGLPELVEARLRMEALDRGSR
ncbi:MAG TPA: AAA family ATPase [Gemmatimonadaceae bacterium]